MNQTKYTKELLKKFNMENAKPAKAPISSSTKLDADERGNKVNENLFRDMIRSLLYLVYVYVRDFKQILRNFT